MAGPFISPPPLPSSFPMNYGAVQPDAPTADGVCPAWVARTVVVRELGPTVSPLVLRSALAQVWSDGRMVAGVTLLQ